MLNMTLTSHQQHVLSLLRDGWRLVHTIDRQGHHLRFERGDEAGRSVRFDTLKAMKRSGAVIVIKDEAQRKVYGPLLG